MTKANRQQAETEDGGPDKSGPRKMLNEEQILQLVPVSQTTLWRMQKRGQFPKSTYISANRRVWFEDEVVAWQNEVNGRGRGRRHHPVQSKP
jgi:predicted DNA-binding transcriptional regulator AlpA